MTQYDQDWWTAESMMLEGGEFVRLLGKLARHADPENLAKIKMTWPKYWSEYHAIGATYFHNRPARVAGN
jgi:hypothetical protein